MYLSVIKYLKKHENILLSLQSAHIFCMKEWYFKQRLSSNVQETLWNRYYRIIYFACAGQKTVLYSLLILYPCQYAYTVNAYTIICIYCEHRLVVAIICWIIQVTDWRIGEYYFIQSDFKQTYKTRNVFDIFWENFRKAENDLIIA